MITQNRQKSNAKKHTQKTTVQTRFWRQTLKQYNQLYDQSE